MRPSKLNDRTRLSSPSPGISRTEQSSPASKTASTPPAPDVRRRSRPRSAGGSPGLRLNPGLRLMRNSHEGGSGTLQAPAGQAAGSPQARLAIILARNPEAFISASAPRRLEAGRWAGAGVSCNGAAARPFERMMSPYTRRKPSAGRTTTPRVPGPRVDEGGGRVPICRSISLDWAPDPAHLIHMRSIAA